MHTTETSKERKDKMPEEKNKTEHRPTLWYAVVHFGPKETDAYPFYLKRIPYPYARGEMVTSYTHFTCDLNEAACFNNIRDADAARRIVEAKLSEIGHQLAGHVKVLQLFGLVHEPLVGEHRKPQGRSKRKVHTKGINK